MKKLLTILFLVSLFGCGSRKVEIKEDKKEVKTETFEIIKKDVTVGKNVKVENITKVDVSNGEVIEETIIEADDKNKPAIYKGKELGNTKTTKRKIKRFKAIKTNSNTNTLINEKTTDKTITYSKKAQQSKDSNKAKVVDKKQFDIVGAILSYWWLLLILVVLTWLYKKYKSTLFI